MKIKIESLNLGEREDLQEDQPLNQMMTMNEANQYNPAVRNPVVENQLSLGERDNYSSQIEQQIQAKREMLLDKQKTLKRRIQENQYLEGVYNDYDKYYNYIRKQKEGQIKQMELLNQYLDDIIVNGKLTDEDIAQNKKEQDEILNSIAGIKTELDKIISR
jgi:predicted N-acyltransferase